MANAEKIGSHVHMHQERQDKTLDALFDPLADKDMHLRMLRRAHASNLMQAKKRLD
jgi:hypothetical protein